MKEERLYIVGYMASGKTTFGKALAEKTGWDFLDLDEEVERLEGRPIAEIIATKGEEAFRQIESRVLKHTATMTRTVIACGGGTPCWRDNMEFMTLHGLTLWLIASPERIAERIREAGDTRPLVSGKSDAELIPFICNHLRTRQPHYCKAQWRLSGEKLETHTDIESAVKCALEALPSIK